MAEKVAESIVYLDASGQRQVVRAFRITQMGVLFDVGATSEVMIPWHRVLEYIGPRDHWRMHHAPNAWS